MNEGNQIPPNIKKLADAISRSKDPERLYQIFSAMGQGAAPEKGKRLLSRFPAGEEAGPHENPALV